MFKSLFHYPYILSLIVLLTFLIASCSEDDELNVSYMSPKDAEEIANIEDSLVWPILYQSVPSLAKLPGDERKLKFVALVLPAVLVVENEIKNLKKRVVELSINKEIDTKDSLWLALNVEKYGAEDVPDLIDRLALHPRSIVIAQSALETGWGTSRFARKAMNFFGIWSYDPEEPRIAASGSDVYLRRYDDLTGSVRDYYLTLARANAYKNFRKMRLLTDDPYELARFLRNYSEEKMRYVNKIRNTIRKSDLRKYDRYQLHPDAFNGKSS